MSNRLYGCSIGNIYEYNLNNLSVVNTVPQTSNTSGVGGILNRLYSSNNTTDELYEHNIDTLAVINTASSPSTSPSDIGGTGDRLYSCDTNSTNLYEHNTSTLAIINTVSAPSSFPSGIGGMNNDLYSCDASSAQIYKHNLDTLAVLGSFNSPKSSPSSIGGVFDRLYSANSALGHNDIYEHNPYTMSVINKILSPESYNNGIGGIKSTNHLSWIEETVDITSPNYPSNYPDNSDETTTITRNDCFELKVFFEDFNTETTYDYVELMDKNDNVVYSYTGNLGSFTSGSISGNTVKIRFVSDSSANRSGFKISKIEKLTYPTSGRWDELSSSNPSIPVDDFVYANNKIYCYAFGAPNNIFEYDMLTNQWNENFANVPPSPKISGVIGDKIYIYYNSDNKMHILDINTKVLDSISGGVYSGANDFTGHLVSGTKIIGRDVQDSLATNTIWIYDTLTNIFTEYSAPLNDGWEPVFVHNDIVYCTQFLNKSYIRYNIGTDTWDEVPTEDISDASFSSSIVVDDIAYVRQSASPYNLMSYKITLDGLQNKKTEYPTGSYSLIGYSSTTEKIYAYSNTDEVWSYALTINLNIADLSIEKTGALDFRASWVNPDNSVVFDVEYQKQSDITWTPIATGITDRFIDFSVSDYVTSYVLRVRARYDEVGEWVNVNFETSGDLTINNFNSLYLNDLKILTSWESTQEGARFDVEYKLSSEAEWIRVASLIEEKSFIFEVDEYNSRYDVRVRSNYGDFNAWSVFNESITSFEYTDYYDNYIFKRNNNFIHRFDTISETWEQSSENTLGGIMSSSIGAIDVNRVAVIRGDNIDEYNFSNNTWTNITILPSGLTSNYSSYYLRVLNGFLICWGYEYDLYSFQSRYYKYEIDGAQTWDFINWLTKGLCSKLDNRLYSTFNINSVFYYDFNDNGSLKSINATWEDYNNDFDQDFQPVVDDVDYLIFSVWHQYNSYERNFLMLFNKNTNEIKLSSSYSSDVRALEKVGDYIYCNSNGYNLIIYKISTDTFHEISALPDGQKYITPSYTTPEGIKIKGSIVMNDKLYTTSSYELYNIFQNSSYNGSSIIDMSNLTSNGRDNCYVRLTGRTPECTKYDDKIFLTDETNLVYYDTVLNTWNHLADSGYRLDFNRCFVFNDYIYAKNYKTINTISVYDRNSDIWIDDILFPSADEVYPKPSYSYNEYLIFTVTSYSESYAKVWMYDTINNLWQEYQDPSGYYNVEQTKIYNNKLYISRGYTTNISVFDLTSRTFSIIAVADSITNFIIDSDYIYYLNNTSGDYYKLDINTEVKSKINTNVFSYSGTTKLFLGKINDDLYTIDRDYNLVKYNITSDTFSEVIFPFAVSDGVIFDNIVYVATSSIGEKVYSFLTHDITMEGI